MLSGSPWCKLRRWLLAWFFITQYHCRMSFLNLRYKGRNISRSNIDERARDRWNKLCQTLATHTVFQNALRTTKKVLESERFTLALQVARRKLEDERLHTALRRAKKGWSRSSSQRKLLLNSWTLLRLKSSKPPGIHLKRAKSHVSDLKPSRPSSVPLRRAKSRALGLRRRACIP